MAKINKFRVVNFIFGGGHAVYKDMTFDLYGGQNLLINLVNQGGKTSLIHFLLQVIKPKVSIAKRKISSYFESTNNTAHAMIEWEVGENEYFLTGICMKRNLSKPEGVDFFTYTSEYENWHSISITNIPILEEDYVKPYSKVLDGFEELEKKYRSFRVYKDSEMNKYREELMSNGIFQEEWELVEKINQDEGALMKLFENAKTSKAVMERWIIECVEDSIKEENSRSFAETIEMNADNFARLKKGESDIAVYNEYIDDINIMLGQADQLARCKDRFQCAIKEFIALDRHLVNESNNINSELQKMNEDLSTAIELKEEAGFRIVSFDYRMAEKEYGITSKKVTDLKGELDELSSEKNKVENLIKMYDAKRYYDEKLYYTNYRTAKQQELEDLKKSDAQVNAELNQIRYSIKIIMKGMLDKFEQDVSKVVERISSTDKKLQELKAARTALVREKERHSKTFAVNKEKVQRLEKELERLKDIIQLDLIYFINEETLTEQIKRTKELEGILRNLISSIQTQKEKTRELDEKIELKYRYLTQYSNEFSVIENKLNDYLKEKESIETGISEYGFGSRDIYSGTIIEEMNNRKDILAVKKNELRTIMDDKLIKIESIKKGSFGTSASAEKILSDSGIDYNKGINWLKEQKTVDRENYISRNPLLPYSIIIDEKDIPVLKQLSFSNMDFIIPILVRNKLSQEVDIIENSVVRVNDKNYFLAAYNKEVLIDEEKMMEYRKQLESETISLKKEITDISFEEGRLIKLIGRTEEFIGAYPLSYYSEQVREKTRIDTLIKETQKEIGDCKTELLNFGHEIEKKEQEKEGIREKVEESKVKEKAIQDHIRISIENEEAKKIRNESFQLVEKYEQEILDLEKEIDDLTEENKVLIKEETEINNKKTFLEQEYTHNYASATEVTIIQGGIAELKEREAGKKRSLTSPEKQEELQKEINSKTESIRKLENKLKGLPYDENELANIVYDEIALSKAEGRKRLIEEDMAKKQNAYTDNYGKMSKAEEKMDNEAKKLMGREACSFDYLDIMERPKLVEDVELCEKQVGEYQKNLNLLLNKEKNIRDHISMLQNTIDILKVEYSLFEGNKEDINAIVVNDIKKYINELRKVYDKANSEIINANADMRDIIGGAYNKYSQYKIAGITNFLGKCSSLISSYDSISLNTQLGRQRELVHKQIDRIREENEQTIKDKDNIVMVCTQFAETIIQDIREFDSKSQVVLDDGTPKRMLKLTIPHMPEEKEILMKGYITDCIEEVIVLKENQVKQKEIMERLKGKLSTKALVNAITPLDNYVLEVYKPKETEYSGEEYTEWDEINSKTSGGEQFAGGFFLFATILTYIRYKKMSSMPAAGGGKFRKLYKESKCIILDNPFGQMSGEPLLQAVFALAKQYNLQTVCFTHLKQNPILNSFNLVYALNGIYGNDMKYMEKEILKGEEPENSLSNKKHIQQNFFYEMGDEGESAV